MRPTTEQMERMVVEITLDIPREDSVLPMDDPEMVKVWDDIARDIANLRKAGMIVDTAAEVPAVVVVPEGWAESQA